MGPTQPDLEAPPKEPEIIKYEVEVIGLREWFSDVKAKLRRDIRGEGSTDEALTFNEVLANRNRDLHASAHDGGDVPLFQQRLPKRKRMLVLRGTLPRAFGLLVLISWFTMMFYLFGFLARQTTSIIDTVKFAASSVHGALAETYEDFRNPGNPQEVADLMLEWYQLLAEMGYYEPHMIGRPPHTPAINVTKAIENGFTEKAIEMVQMLPYIGIPPPGREDEDFFAWGHGACDNAFLKYGCFVDYRKDDFFHEPRDPRFGLEWDLEDNTKIKDWDEDGGRYMRPEYVELMIPGDHGAFMVLDTGIYRIWTVDTESGNADPATQDIEIQELPNRLDMNNFPSRPARLVLRDYIQKFIDLEWMPGGLSNGTREGDEYARMYLEHGWPSSFNRSSFMIARKQWEEAERKRFELEQPFEDLRIREMDLKMVLENIQRKQKQVTQVDAGANLPYDQKTREGWREWLMAEIKLVTESLPQVHADLEAAREACKKVEPAVRKFRADRITKYGW